MNNSIPYLEGHLLETGGAPSSRSKPTQPIAVQVGMTVGRILIPYVLALSLFGSMVTVSLTFLPDSRERTAMGTFGTIAFLGTLIVSYYEWWCYDNQHAPAPKSKQVEPTPMPSQGSPLEIVMRKENATGYHERTIKVPNPPSATFVIAVYRSRQSTGRIPGERFFADPAQFGGKADAWLDVLEQLEIVEKIGEYETSPRRWSDHWTLDKALRVFGYVEEAEEAALQVPAQVPAQPQTVRAQLPATPKMPNK